jgi:general secretion pathway protein D
MSLMMHKPFVWLACTCILATGLTRAQGDARITPNFRDADILQVIEAVRQATGRTFIIDPRVRATVTMLSSTPMTPTQFYEAFQSILAVHNFVAIRTGNIVKILPGDNARMLPGNDLSQRVNSSSDEFVTQIVAVRTVPATQIVAVLRPLMPANANLAIVSGSNLLIVTDRANNVARLMGIIQEIDRRGSSDIEVIPLANATSTDAVRALTAALGNTGADAGSTLRVVGDERTNSVIISGDSAARQRAKSLLTSLDSPLDAGTETRVRVLEFADAEAMATKLKEQFSSTGGTGTGQNAANVGGRIGGVGNVVQAAALAQSQAVGGTTTLFGGTATVIADKDTNSLIITAAQRTQKAIEVVLKQLDVRTPQVLIEAIIAEVISNTGSDLGVNWVLDGSNVNFAAGAFTAPVLSGSTSSPLVDLTGVLTGATTTVPSSLGGTVFGVGRLSSTGVNFGAVLQALQSDARNNIVAKPQIMTTNNLETKITVARKVPFITGQYTGSTGTTSAFQTINREEVGTLFTVTPRITKGDRVSLKIQVESSEVEKALTAGAAGLVTKDNTINTTVLIKDGDWLVLGGMISDSADATEARVPLLGRIPLLGELFRTRSKSHEKRNLMVFIKPTIILDDEQATTTTREKYDYLREQQQKSNQDTTLLPLVPFKGLPVLPEQPPGKAPASTGTKP